ncbi:type II toxin-antitoxin system CcdA family antitoxin [Maricaulis sp.]|uniref:type II toxin-antitoxin system CcdA family antitoxin n=1 Tax=Maricaulis sp. TaxID=1486257 RepID=UPI00260698B9|nr:type II toxin-antitoxin system CcdA family antitoxin [Maricaulis sp.]
MVSDRGRPSGRRAGWRERVAVRERKGRRWREENRAAIEAHNRRIEREGAMCHRTRDFRSPRSARVLENPRELVRHILR